MKTLSNTIAKTLVVISIFTAGATLLSTSGTGTFQQAHAAVSYQTAYSYLINHGYTVITLEETFERSNEDWIAHTIKNNVHYWTTLHVEGTSIIWHEDVIF